METAWSNINQARILFLYTYVIYYPVIHFPVLTGVHPKKLFFGSLMFKSVVASSNFFKVFCPCMSKKWSEIPASYLIILEVPKCKIHLFLLQFLVEWIIKRYHKAWDLSQITCEQLFEVWCNSKAGQIGKLGGATTQILSTVAVWKHGPKYIGYVMTWTVWERDITDFSAHKFSALFCSFLKENFVIWLVPPCSVLLLGDEISGSSLCSGQDFSGLASFLLEGFIYWIKAFRFFHRSIMLLSLRIILQLSLPCWKAQMFHTDLHFGFVLSEWSGNNQSFYSSVLI